MSGHFNGVGGAFSKIRFAISTVVDLPPGPGAVPGAVLVLVELP